MVRQPFRHRDCGAGVHAAALVGGWNTCSACGIGRRLGFVGGTYQGEFRVLHEPLFGLTDLHGRAFAGYHGRTVAPIALNRALYDNLFLRDTLCVPENRLPINGDFYTVPASNAIVMPLPADDKTDWSAMRAQVDYAFPPGLRARVQRELAARRDPPVPCGLSVQVLPTTHGRYLLIGKAPASDAHIRAVHLLPELAVPR